MTDRRTNLMDVREIIHRLRAGNRKRQIAGEMKLNWRTVSLLVGDAEEL